MRLFLLLLLIPCFCLSQKLFVEQSKVSFYSWAPLEDISAISNTLEGVVDFDTGDFFFRIPINTFVFPSSLMQKHFNEKYMESDIYSMSSFKGHFTKKISISKNQEVSISAKGILSIHGIDHDVTIETNLNIKNQQIAFSSEFNVLLKDYKIKVPKIVRMNIADTISVSVSGNLIHQ
tara:strand:- start:1073 stop:1603 length:531 start_codon:yes stop_codon:yes gene_type:complete